MPTEQLPEDIRGMLSQVGGSADMPDDVRALVEAAQPSERTALQSLLRQLGLTGRAITEGVVHLPNMLADATAGAVNLGVRGVNAATGTDIPQMGRPSDAIRDLIDRYTPRPENATERVVNRMGRGLTSLATGMGAAQSAAGLGPAAATLSSAITSNPGSQVSAVLGMDAGGGMATEMYPDSPVADLVGSAAGGVGGLAAHELARYGINVARAAASPVTRPGQERIVGTAIRETAQNPGALQDRLATGQREIVPGSLRSTAEVANDPGLMQLERGVRSIGPREGAEFALRDASRNAARGAAIESMAPRLDQSAAGDIVRERLTRSLRNSAEDVSRAYRAVDPNAGAIPGRPIWETAARAVNDMYGRATHGAPQELVDIINRLRAETFSVGDLQAMIRETGNIAGQAQVRNDGMLARTAGAVRQALQGALDDAAASGAQGLSPVDTAALRVGSALRRNQGAVFDEGATGRVLDTNQFGRPIMPTENVPRTLMAGPTAIRQYEAAAGADPVARQAMQGAFVDRLRRAIETTTPDAQGNPVLSPARFHNLLRDNREQARILFGAEGVQHLESIARDFTSRQMVDNVGRAIGSNTVQNFSTAAVIRAVTGGMIDPARFETNPLLKPLRWLYRGGDQRIQELLAEAMLNPDLAARLVNNATPENVSAAVDIIRRTAMAGRLAEPAIPAIAGAPRRQDMRRERTQ
jgi:hypothetical protein